MPSIEKPAIKEKIIPSGKMFKCYYWFNFPDTTGGNLDKLSKRYKEPKQIIRDFFSKAGRFFSIEEYMSTAGDKRWFVVSIYHERTNSSSLLDELNSLF